MGMIEDLSRTLDTEEGARRLTGARNLPAVQAPMYNPESVPRIAGPSTNLPAVQAPLYTPEAPPQIAAQPAQQSGPIARAAGMAGRLAGGAGALLAGGAAATEAATGTVASNPEYFRSSIGDDGLAANILTAGQAPQTIADVAKSQPVTARTQNGPLSVPTIAQTAGDSTAGAGRGMINPPNTIADVARTATAPQYDDTYRAQNLTNNLNQAYREGDPIGQIIQQRLGQQGGAQQQAPGAPVGGGVVSGGDKVYAPGQPMQMDPFKTADGRTLDPNDPNMAAADRGAISQFQARNAQMTADIEQQQRSNPLAGAVQIIRPGSQVSYAVQAPDRMVELTAPGYAQYQSAFERNPGMASRAQMSEGGMTVDGQLAPANLVGYGDDALKTYNANARKDAETGLDPETLAKIAQEKAKGESAAEVARIAAKGHIDAAKVTNGAGDVDQAATAPILGVPVPAVTPWSNQTNSRDANKVKAAEIARGGKEVEKDSDAARAAAATAQDAKRFLELNKKVSTGGVLDRFGPTRALQGMGSDYGTMEALTAKLAPGMRQPGSGATSDFDAKQFERATVGVDKPLKTNENIVNALNAQAQQQQDYANFRQTYLEQNRTLQGSDRYWKEYTDKNPIFDPKKESTFDLNPERKDWREHFSPKSGAPSSAQGAAPAVQPTRKTVGDRTFENDGKGWYEVK